MVQVQCGSAEDQSSYLSDNLAMNIANLKIDDSSSPHTDKTILREINTIIEDYSEVEMKLYNLHYQFDHEKEIWEEDECECADFVREQHEKFQERCVPLQNTLKVLYDRLQMLQKNHSQHISKINNSFISTSSIFVPNKKHATELSGESLEEALSCWEGLN
jgi:hypothetical protein